jgi:hypothetical protein
VVDRFDSMIQPYLISATPVASNIIDVRFNQAMSPDGGVFVPANYQLSGLGKGTAATSPSTVTYLATASEPTYRLTWNSGNMNGMSAVLTAVNSLDVRGNALWNGSQFPLTTLPKIEVDSDFDGMPDAWETLYSLNPNSNVDAILDRDGDGQSNLDEYLANTHPVDSSSRFHIKRMEDSGNPALTRIVWASQPGMVYYVETSESLLVSSWSPVHVNAIVANSGETQWDAPISGNRRFYRVRSFRPNPLIVVP